MEPDAPGPPGGVDTGTPPAAAAAADFFLSNYRLGKTLGIGSFGKVRGFGGGAARDRGRARYASREGRGQKKPALRDCHAALWAQPELRPTRRPHTRVFMLRVVVDSVRRGPRRGARDDV